MNENETTIKNTTQGDIAKNGMNPKIKLYLFPRDWLRSVWEFECIVWFCPGGLCVSQGCEERSYQFQGEKGRPMSSRGGLVITLNGFRAGSPSFFIPHI